MIELTNSQELGKTIRTLRKKAKLSQERLGELASLSRTAVQTLESGKETTQLDTVFKALRVLNIRLYGYHPLLDNKP